MRIVKLMPMPALQRATGRAMDGMEMLLSHERGLFAHDLPIWDRIYVQTGGLDDDLETCFHILDR